MKSKFALWQPRCYNLLIEKKDKKIQIFEAFIFFWKFIVTVSLKMLSSNTTFRWNTFRKFFTLLNSIVSVENLTRWKRSLNYFWLTTMLVILETKILLVSITKFLYQIYPPYTKWVSFTQLYLKLLGSYNFYITYLYVIETCLNVTVAMF